MIVSGIPVFSSQTTSPKKTQSLAQSVAEEKQPDKNSSIKKLFTKENLPYTIGSAILITGIGILTHRHFKAKNLKAASEGVTTIPKPTPASEISDTKPINIEEVLPVGKVDNPLTQANKELAQAYMDELKITNDRHLIAPIVENLVSKTEELNINDATDMGHYLLAILKNPNSEFASTKGVELLSRDHKQLAQTVKNPDKLHKILTEISEENEHLYEYAVQHLDELKINNASAIRTFLYYSDYKDQKYLLEELIPEVIKHSDNLKIKKFLDFDSILESILESKKEYLEIVAQNSEKLDVQIIAKFIEKLNDNNINNFPTIAQNIEAFNLPKHASSEEVSSILNLKENDIEKIIQNYASTKNQ